jgi:hypothetical protein
MSTTGASQGKSGGMPWGWIIGVTAILVLFGSCNGDDGSSGGGSTGGGGGSGYTGSYHDDNNGNPVPDDCQAWAESSDNPIGSSDRVEVGLGLCEGYG